MDKSSSSESDWENEMDDFSAMVNHIFDHGSPSNNIPSNQGLPTNTENERLLERRRRKTELLNTLEISSFFTEELMEDLIS